MAIRWFFFSSSDLCSARQYGAFRDLPGMANVKIPGGYRNVFASLHERVESKVIFDKKVTEIDYSSVVTEGGAVWVRCGDGSQFSADFVVVSASLGHLKERHGTMFKPALPVSEFFGHISAI